MLRSESAAPAPGRGQLADVDRARRRVQRPRRSRRDQSSGRTTSRAHALVALENTHNRGGGAVFPPDDVSRRARWRDRRGLALHLDGARIWNAARRDRRPSRVAAPRDSCRVCLCKGLGAPVGSLVRGSRDSSPRARFRKWLGGGMRQAGVLAAAGCTRSTTTSSGSPTTTSTPGCSPRPAVSTRPPSTPTSSSCRSRTRPPSWPRRRRRACWCRRWAPPRCGWSPTSTSTGRAPRRAADVLRKCRLRAGRRCRRRKATGILAFRLGWGKGAPMSGLKSVGSLGHEAQGEAGRLPGQQVRVPVLRLPGTRAPAGRPRLRGAPAVRRRRRRGATLGLLPVRQRRPGAADLPLPQERPRPPRPGRRAAARCTSHRRPAWHARSARSASRSTSRATCTPRATTTHRTSRTSTRRRRSRSGTTRSTSCCAATCSSTSPRTTSPSPSWHGCSSPAARPSCRCRYRRTPGRPSRTSPSLTRRTASGCSGSSTTCMRQLVDRLAAGGFTVQWSTSPASTPATAPTRARALRLLGLSRMGTP